MKKTMFAILAAVLVLTLLGTGALAASGAVTKKSVKAYADAGRKVYLGTIPACTAVAVRSWEDYADVYYKGGVVYVDSSALFDDDTYAKYEGVLKSGTKVYQRPSTSSASCKLSRSAEVLIIKVNGDWALIEGMASGMFGFVKVNKLTGIKLW